MTYREMAAADVAWYIKHGKHLRERLAVDADGTPYVVGDWSWARRHPDKPETIDAILVEAKEESE